MLQLQEWHIVGHAQARVVLQSLHPSKAVPPLTTLEVEFPRVYLAEFNTHTRLSRNSASSRAIPVWKRLRAIIERPYVPTSFGVNKPGMSSELPLSDKEQEHAVEAWRIGMHYACIQAFALAGGTEGILADAKGSLEAQSLCLCMEELSKELGNPFPVLRNAVHKQHANRVLEPYAYHTVVTTATHWRNFLGLRASKHAQPEAQDFGLAMAYALKNAQPQQLRAGGLHLPYVSMEDVMECADETQLAMASSAKCARVSYMTHDGVRSVVRDIEMADGLKMNGHMSPFQHPARAIHGYRKASARTLSGNYAPGWYQLRKQMEHEGDFSKLVSRDDLIVGCREDESLVDFILGLPA
ncbi:hypothetical protein A3C87_01035 [Candidatus Kaiserbacteria bacterium RIFCSPHIGHO2_02_FULL_49_34]|uniref:Thymidylate synthase n=1 Tax=Candidatus Kaiserbacteria bacterium RIFCSPHIGHO2_02_FULL_49_34 TaxID=1798491 RepID=A0A1F6DKQ3_9BACT|nr:MAG: hypothetical protein A3C87_01035 [Candidatus Kaiserbacteria bacterium RIFCSPHIGHO2_02_FULL_49_34]